MPKIPTSAIRKAALKKAFGKALGIAKAIKYDFGGAEYPIDAETGKVTHTVIDRVSEKRFRDYGKLSEGGFKNPYIKQDVTKPFKVPKGEEINVSRVMRYVEDPKKLQTVIDNIDRNLAKGGEVRLFDYEDIIDKALPLLKNKGYKVTKKELINKYNEGDVEIKEWLVKLKSRLIGAPAGEKTKKIYRLDADPEELLKVGYESNRKGLNYDPWDMMESSNPDALYWSPSVEDMQASLPELAEASAKALKPNVIGTIRANAKIKRIKERNIDPDKYQRLADKAEAEGYDFIERKGDIYSGPGGLGQPTEELLQLRPNNVHAKIKVGNKWKSRLIGAAGAVGAVGVLSNDKEANAMGIEKPLVTSLFKQATKQGLGKAVKKGLVSSASAKLEGTVYKDSIIQKVLKGSGNWRYIQLANGTEELVDKEVVNSLARSAGTAAYGKTFEKVDVESKMVQAIKSMHLRKANANEDAQLVLDYHKRYKEQLQMAGKPIPELSLVKQGNKHFTIPTKYAKLLEAERMVKIIQDLTK